MKQELIEYGLSDKEAEIFLICLKTGEATGNRIAELADLPRSTVYDILEKLRVRGLISTFTVKSKTHFIAANPKTLLISLQEKERKIKRVLPDLEKIQQKVKEKPVAEVYRGKIAVIKLLEEILENAKILRVIGSQGNALEKIDYHPEKFRKKRLEKKIKIKQLLEYSDQSKEIKNDSYTEVRFLKSLHNSTEATFIFDKFVYHLILQYEISAIKIISQDHSKATEIMFDELWAQAKKVKG